MDRMEELLEKPCWIIDILPERVPERSGGQSGTESGEERNPDERMLALAEKIAAAEGMFVWKGE